MEQNATVRGSHPGRERRSRNTDLASSNSIVPGGTLDQASTDILAQWNLYEDGFLSRCDEHQGYVLKLRSVTHDETLHTQDLRQHGGNISLLGVYGRAKRRERLLGYILLYTGDPWVKPCSWYCGIFYSDETDVRRKQPELIKADQNIRLYVAGLGKFDYLFCMKSRTREHDELDTSDAAVHRETADHWRDGL